MQASQKEVTTIEVVSDVVCPWCFIGKRRLEKALALLGRNDVRVRWRPFELNPGIAPEGVNREQHRIRKFGSLARARQLEAHVAAAGAEEGIRFQFDRIETTPNTFDAHRLLWLADREGKQDELAERLFQAYFIDGEDVGDHAMLTRADIASGLNADAVSRMLSGDQGEAEVLADESETRSRGVNGVPTFFVDGIPITSGAQPPAVLASLLGPVLAPAEQCSLEDANC